MNFWIRLKPNTRIEWFHSQLIAEYPYLKDKAVSYENMPDGLYASVSIKDEDEIIFVRRVRMISSQVLEVKRA